MEDDLKRKMEDSLKNKIDPIVCGTIVNCPSVIVNDVFSCKNY
jgi:hypothetical protein